MDNRQYITQEEYQSIMQLVDKFECVSKKDAQKLYYYKELELLCNSLSSQTVGGVHNILLNIPALALSITGGNRTAYFENKMYDFESFVK